MDSTDGEQTRERLDYLRKVVQGWEEEFGQDPSPEFTLLINGLTTNYASVTSADDEVQLVELAWYGSHCEIPGMTDYEVVRVERDY